MNDQQSYYETMYILRPDIAEDEVTNHIDKYNKLLEEFGGTILDSQMRGKRRLAYQIAKHREGIYVQLSHQGCLLYTSPSPRDGSISRMPSSA